MFSIGGSGVMCEGPVFRELQPCREKNHHGRQATQAASPTVREAVQWRQGLALDVPKKLFLKYFP